MEPQEQSVSPNSSIADVLAIPGTDKHSQEVLKKFHWAIKQVSNEHGTNNDASLTQEELIQLIRTWEPQRDIVCLYVRWSRQLKRNFNLDSIATLLCLSRQCGYTPLDFLRKVKTLSILKNQKASYGVTFNFDIPNRRDINRERLNKEFIGLSVTLALLQEQVTEMPSILGKTKMRQSGPRNPRAIDLLHVEGKDKQPASIVTHPNVEFHTQSSLLNRIWLSIKHRWLSLYMTEHLFREANQPSWSFQEGLIFSFQMMAPCGPGRYEFLSPLVGYCLRFPTQETIDAKRARLREIWKDPSSFLSYGDMCLTQFSTDTRIRVIAACFRDLHSDIPATSKQISYHRDCTWLRRWNILRAYIFHFWLDSDSNSDLKSIINKGLSTSTHAGVQKNKKSPPDNTIASETGNNDSSNSGQGQVQVEKPSPGSKRFKSGLHSITSSRRKPSATAPRTSNHENPDDVYDSTADGKIGNSKTTPHLPAPNEVDGRTQTLFHDTDWTGLRLITSEELESIVQSYLLIHRHDGVDVISGLSPIEVYSADNLHDLSHCRLSGPSPFFPKTKLAPVYLHVSSDADQFIDTTGRSFHVAREQSSHFIEHSHHLPALHQILQLCKAIVRHGKVDSKRAIGQHRVNIGNGGQNWIDAAPCKLHGLRFEKELEQDGDFDATEVLQSIGRLVEFTWHVTCSIQNDTSDHPIAPDKVRRKLYAESLGTYLNMDEEVGFEDLTLVVSSLHPVAHEVSEHKDCMNDTLAGYTRTAAFNMVLIGDKDEQSAIIHFQVICNFRKVIGNFVVPFHSCLSNVAKHCRQYLQKWQRNMQFLFGGKTNTIPTAYDRSAFFLDDCLEFSTIAISEVGKHKQTITSEYILTEINISRTMSLSMFIDPLVKMQHVLKFDQTIELALACSFLSNPFWFDWTMSSLIQRHDNQEESFRLERHPFYDWSRTTIEIFGAWQGGPYNRWSPCGGSKESVLETFGAQPNASREARQRGERKLSQVVSILLDHVQWINSLTAFGDKPVVDMPLSMMKARCDKTVNDIAQVASCQFSHFRLGILTTILSGCGLLKTGKHLRNCMYPVKGSASYKHLSRPTADCMSRERACALGDNVQNESISNDGQGCVQEQHHDLFMQYLSVNLGFKVYVRDEMECILCESHPMRSLNCRDWFRKGMSLYDCNENGEFFSRAYGRNTRWVQMIPPEEYEFAYLGTTSIQYIPIDARLSYYAANFGEDLRANNCKKVRFKGRSSRTSGHQRLFTNSYQSTRDTFCHPSMQMADFYIGSQARNNRLQAMFVLGDAEHAVEVNNCNELYKFQSGKIIHKHLQTLLLSNDQQETTVMAAGCYHMDSELTNHVTAFFPGHLDKPFVHTVWFVPLGTTAFFTVISVSATCTLMQDQDSLTYFNEWMDKLSIDERQNVDEFLCDFDYQAKMYMKQDLVSRVIYLNKLGSVLSFPANQCYHATITPKKPKGFPRDMFIFHPLDGIS